jgi:hypothetical protein
MPIYNSDKKIIGVTELINKVNGRITNVMLSQLFVLDDRGKTVTKSYE